VPASEPGAVVESGGETEGSEDVGAPAEGSETDEDVEVEDAEVTSDLSEAEPATMGSLSRDDIQGRIRPRLPEFQRCYESELLHDPQLAGRLEIGFTIGENGSVIAVETKGFPNKKVEDCVGEIIRTMTFPKPKGGGNVVVTYPFIFRAEE
jgi:hypothetical protein